MSRRTTQLKRAKIRFERDARQRAVQRFKARNSGKTVSTHQYWDAGTQWGDFDFIHPTRRLIVRVCARTLAMAYNDACEEEADRLTADLDKPWNKKSMRDMFIPIHRATKSSKRPRVWAYQMREDPPEVKAARDAYYAAKKKAAVDVANSGALSVSEEVKVERMPYGLFVTMAVDLPELRETDFQTMQDLAIGVTKPTNTPKTFTRAQLLSIFGYDEATPDDVGIMQSLAVNL
jgi:hypothetical protein